MNRTKLVVFTNLKGSFLAIFNS